MPNEKLTFRAWLMQNKKVMVRMSTDQMVKHAWDGGYGAASVNAYFDTMEFLGHRPGKGKNKNDKGKP